MAHKIRVLKTFRFSHNKDGGRLPKEDIFTPGEHEIDDHMANHPWIKDHFADGHIERPELAVKRLEAEKKAAEFKAQEAAFALSTAEKAMARLVSSQPNLVLDKDAIERELNTPVNVLRNGQNGNSVVVDVSGTGSTAPKDLAAPAADAPAADAPAADAPSSTVAEMEKLGEQETAEEAETKPENITDYATATHEALKNASPAPKGKGKGGK